MYELYIFTYFNARWQVKFTPQEPFEMTNRHTRRTE